MADEFQSIDFAMAHDTLGFHAIGGTPADGGSPSVLDADGALVASLAGADGADGDARAAVRGAGRVHVFRNGVRLPSDVIEALAAAHEPDEGEPRPPQVSKPPCPCPGPSLAARSGRVQPRSERPRPQRIGPRRIAREV